MQTERMNQTTFEIGMPLQSLSVAKRCKDMKEGASPLNLNKCFEIINEHAWIPNNNNDMPYPFFLKFTYFFFFYSLTQKNIQTEGSIDMVAGRKETCEKACSNAVCKFRI